MHCAMNPSCMAMRAGWEYTPYSPSFQTKSADFFPRFLHSDSNLQVWNCPNDDADEVHCILRPDQLNALLWHIKLNVSQQHTDIQVFASWMCWSLATPNTAAFSGSVASRFPTESTISATDKVLYSADHLECSVVTLFCPQTLCFTAVWCSCFLWRWPLIWATRPSIAPWSLFWRITQGNWIAVIVDHCYCMHYFDYVN